MDEEPRGFGLRVFGSGRKVWVVRYTTLEGRRRWIQIGDYPTLTLDEGRALARQKLALVAQGKDPMRLRAEARQQLTVAQLCDRFLADYAEEYRPGTVSEDRRRIVTHIKPALGSLRLSDVGVDSVARLHTKIGKVSRVDANRTINLVRRMYNLAGDWGLIPRGTNPAAPVKRYKEVARDRWLTQAEMGRLLDAIAAYGRGTDIVPTSLCSRLESALDVGGVLSVADLADMVGAARADVAKAMHTLMTQGRAIRVGNALYERGDRLTAGRPRIYVQAALWLYVLTGVRRSELLSARWDQVDFERATLRLPVTKAGRPHTVPLSTHALNVLRSLPRIEGNPHVLPGRKPGAHLVDISKAWRGIRKQAGLEDVRLHDLRRTAGSWLVQDGNTLLVVGKALNHSDTRSTLVYARMSQEPVRSALERYGEQVSAAAGNIGLGEIGSGD